ncbi:MAG: tetratricopeptide repeat protein [candidate division WOR-3 bacterium]|nr:tetratricopeptide repeat protein [candidate division WOR-3 bacterium]
MPLDPKHTPKGDRPAAERQFVGREEFIAPANAALQQQPQRTDPLVLVYYGGAGIGKSRLRRELTKQMAADPGVLTATLDFDIPIFRQPETALLTLRNAIRETYKVRFPSFDLAYAIYWQKTHAESPLGDDLRPLLEPGSLIAQLLDDTGKLPLVGLVPRIAALAAKSLESSTPRPPDSFLSDWWERRGERELEDLPQMEPGTIVEQLPKLWAADLKDYLKSGSSESGVGSSETGGDSPISAPHSRSAVLFIDTYEGLWETGSTEADFFKRDEWVRGLVKQLSEVLWIVCGRQKLRWEEVETDWGKALSQRQLGALPDKSARRFLESCDITNGQIQDAIVKGSQGVPHYLDLAVDTVQSSKFLVHSSKFQGSGPDELVAEFTRQLDQPEIDTLNVLSATRFWYYGLFENLMTKYQTGYPLTAYDDLSRFSFVSEGAAPGTRTMHQLMREALQESQSPELRKRVHLFLHKLYAKQLAGLNVKNITDLHRTALTEAFYHGRQAKSAAELWTWFEAALTVFDAAGQYRLLTPLLQDVVQSLETELGPNHPSVAESLFRLAKVFSEQGEYDEAEPLYRRALAIFEREHGPEHETVCGCLVWLARTLRNRGRHDEAEVLCRRALGVMEQPGRAAALQLDAVNNLASVLIEEEKYNEAEEFARRALTISEKELGPDHSDTSDSLNTLAVLFMMQRRYAESESLLRRALANLEKNLGTNHPLVMITMDNLGMVLHHLCRYTEAESLHRRALRISEETLGPGHPDTALVMNQLGTVLREQGRYAEAEPLLRRALAVFQKKAGPDHPYTIRMTSNLIGLLTKRGNYAEAEPMVLSAIATHEKKLGPDHPQTAHALHAAGLLYRDQGRYAEAETYLRRSLEIRTRVNGPEHPDTLTSLDSLGTLEDRRGRYAEAESLYRDALEKRERVLGPEHPGVASNANRLAGLCCRDGRYAEAEALYRRALAIREKIFGLDHPFTAETLEGLANVCEQTGRTAEARELAARAKAIRDQNAKA